MENTENAKIIVLLILAIFVVLLLLIIKCLRLIIKNRFVFQRGQYYLSSESPAPPVPQHRPATEIATIIQPPAQPENSETTSPHLKVSETVYQFPETIESETNIESKEALILDSESISETQNSTETKAKFDIDIHNNIEAENNTQTDIKINTENNTVCNIEIDTEINTETNIKNNREIEIEPVIEPVIQIITETEL